MEHDRPDAPEGVENLDDRADREDPGILGSAGDPDDPDDLEPLRGRVSRRSRLLIAVLAAAAMVLPLGGWLFDEVAFRSSGDTVTEALGEDAALADALLLVRSVTCSGAVSTGTGFAVDLGAGPVVVTNRHVVENTSSVGVRPLAGGPAVAVTANRLSAIADVAVLELADADALPPALRRGSHPGLDDEVRLVGFPAAQPFTITGTVAGADAARLVLDLPTDPGTSGSPVLDGQGRVVGQVYARSADGRGIATPVDLLAEAVATATPAPSC